jgi:hypothetical protein
VAEYQRRGTLHFHLVVRVDASQPKPRAERVEPPAAQFSGELLAEAIRAAAAHVRVPMPDADSGRLGGVRWGRQVDVRVLDAKLSVEERASCAAYIAKYATKSTEVVGGFTQPLSGREVESLRVRPHVHRMVRCAWELAVEPRFRGLRLRRWAHTLGFRGHCFTKSRRYSTTFTALRRARHEHVLARLHGGRRRDPWGRPWDAGETIEHKHYAFTGIGYRTLGDAWLAETGAASARERRRIAREELCASQLRRLHASESIHDAGRHR